MVLHKFFIRGCDKLDGDFMKYEPFFALCLMQNVKSLGIYGFVCLFYKVMWDIVGNDFYYFASKVFSTCA